MAIQVVPLSYNIDALEPVISVSALNTHYEEHYKKYVGKLNDLIPDTVYEDLSLREIVIRSGKKIQWDHEIKIFNNANQAWNHTFFWQCLTPARNMVPSERVRNKIIESFGSFDNFIEQFSLKSNELFGSGWVWLVLSKNMNLEIMVGKNDENPLPSGNIPLFVVDLWEHAYYIDYRSSRAEYLENIWQLVNWSFVEVELIKAEKFQKSRESSREAIRSLPLYFRQKWIGSAPTHLKRRKTSVRTGAMFGSIIGAVLFFFFASLVSVDIIPLPGLFSSASSVNTILILAVGIVLGGCLGAACGALVGIGTPMPLNDPSRTI